MMDWRNTWIGSLGGLNKGKLLGEVGSHVDKSLPAGSKSSFADSSLKHMLWDTVTLQYFFFSPNLPWLILVTSVYCFFPYDWEAAKTYEFEWMLNRFYVNFGVLFAYYSMFFIPLYVTKSVGERKWVPNSWPTLGNMIHDKVYWTFGVMQMTIWEVIVIHCMAVGKLPYLTDADVLGNTENLMYTIFWLLMVPPIRDFQFYFSHRFLHIRPFYKFSHSIHHRNADPQPFSGMAMHPIEHLYYYACSFLPILYITGHPLVFMYCYWHIVLAPAGGHSGFEDNADSDLFLFAHHFYSSCNYGAPPVAWLDGLFGTLRTRIPEKSAAQIEKEKENPREWSPQGYLGVPTWDQGMYNIFTCFMLYALVWGAMWHEGEQIDFWGMPMAEVVALTVSAGALAFGCLLTVHEKMSWRFPFHKESNAVFWFHFIVNIFFNVMPIYHATKWACQ